MVLTHASTLLNLENSMLSKRDQIRKTTYYLFIGSVQNRQICRQKADWMKGGGRDHWRMTANGFSFGE